MTSYFWTRKNFAVAAAVVTIACVVLAIAIGLAHPVPIPSAVLGPDWQCTRLAFVLTTCARAARANSASASVRKDPACPRQTVLIQPENRTGANGPAAVDAALFASAATASAGR
jgi:hypothetical protein